MHCLTDLLPMHLDLLKEVGNVGAGHAATSLSSLLNKRIDLSIPSVKVVPFSNSGSLNAEEHVAATYFRLSGDISGHFFIMFLADHASKMISHIVSGGDISQPGLAESAFCEIGNILCGSYLTALSKLLDIKINQTPPVMSIDMAGAILGEGLIELSLYGEDMLMIETVLFEHESQNKIKGEFIFLPDPHSLNKMFKVIEGRS